MHTKKLPARFFDDHADRDLPTPRVLRRTARHVWVSVNDPSLPELKDDAAHYADADGPDDAPRGLRVSARATLAAIG